jgi:hypothetical protein
MALDANMPPTQRQCLELMLTGSVARCRIDPMRVLEDHDDRLPACQTVSETSASPRALRASNLAPLSPIAAA